MYKTNSKGFEEFEVWPEKQKEIWIFRVKKGLWFHKLVKPYVLY